MNWLLLLVCWQYGMLGNWTITIVWNTWSSKYKLLTLYSLSSYYTPPKYFEFLWLKRPCRQHNLQKRTWWRITKAHRIIIKCWTWQFVKMQSLSIYHQINGMMIQKQEYLLKHLWWCSHNHRYVITTKYNNHKVLHYVSLECIRVICSKN